MPRKVWIKGFEGLYKISEEGEVYSYKVKAGLADEGYKLKQSKNTKGYHQLRIYDHEGKGHSVRVHRIVADSFVKKQDGCPQIDHIDNNKSNNSSTNLRWVTNQINTQKALSNVYYLVHKDGTGIFIYNLNKWCNTFKFNIQTLYKMKNGQRKSAYGFTHMEVYHS